MSNAPANLPPPLRGVEANTFTEYTIRVRFPETVETLLKENDFSPTVQRRVQQLLDEIPNGRLRPLNPTDGGHDHALWRAIMQPHDGETWLSAPWLKVEFYLYRRILEATGYFQHGEGFGVDPFRRKKRRSLLDSQADITSLAAQVNQNPALDSLLRIALWGNQADLSLWQAGDEDNPAHQDENAQQQHTLADDTTAVLAHLRQATPPRHVHVINDNAGFELITDLALADGLLQTETAASVTFNLKAHPTFVSDATVADAHDTIDFLANQTKTGVRSFGERMRRRRANGRLHFTTHPAWTLPLPFWALPDDLLTTLASATLLISKGDANYRRLLGDRHWPFDTPFSQIVNKPPAPLLALRTLKSEVVSGLSHQQLTQLNNDHPNWLTNGKWGLIQFAAK